MNYRKITVIASALGIVAFTGCSSTPSENTDNSADGKKVLEQMQASPGWRFAEAESKRDANSMFAIAQDAAKKNPEAAKKLYERCAFVAAMQQNKALFDAIAAEDGSVKKYAVLIQKGTPSLLPQLVKADSVAEAAKVGNGMQPIWGSFIADCYENLSKTDAENIAANVNSARESFSAEDLLAAAKELSAYKAKSEVPEQLKVQTIVREAVNLTEVSGNAQTMQSIIDFCREKSILPDKEQKELAQTLKSMGKTRSSYLDFNYNNSIHVTQRSQGNYNVRDVRFSDGSTMTYRTNRLEDAVVDCLQRSPRLRRQMNRCMGKNSSYMSSDTMQQLAGTIALMCKQKGISVEAAIRAMEESMSNY